MPDVLPSQAALDDLIALVAERMGERTRDEWLAIFSANDVGANPFLTPQEFLQSEQAIATGKTANNHWVVTGPHIMITGAAAKTLGLTEAADPDPSKPYMMWAGTPYEHAMVPVAAK